MYLLGNYVKDKLLNFKKLSILLEKFEISRYTKHVLDFILFFNEAIKWVNENKITIKNNNLILKPKMKA